MPSLINLLKDVDVKAISLVPGGANGQRIFLYKCDGFECATAQSMPDGRIVKADGDDWSSFYIVVAEPGAEEKPGVYGDQTTRDVWASEDEIRKAAHRFMKNGGLINKLHQDMEPYGQLVENAIAHQDFTVNNETIRKGSWYIAVEPTDEGRRLVNAGELGGVSIQGLGIRAPMEKDAALVADDPSKQNWIDRTGTGQLPPFIGDIAGDLISERGKTRSQAIQLAVGICENWCSGRGNVTAKTRAKACAAIAEWNAKKAEAHAMHKDGTTVASYWLGENEVDEGTWSYANSGMIEKMEQDGLLRRVAKAIGINPDDEYGDADYITLTKRDFSADKRKELASKGHAMSDGSFPIENCGDVSNAVKLARTDEQRQHTISRAKSLGCTGQLPDSWGLQKDGGTVEPTHQEDEVELADRVEKIETAQKEQGEKLDALTSDDSPIMKGIQDLRLKFEEKPSEKTDEEKAAEKTDKGGESKSETVEKNEPISKDEGDALLSKLNEVAEDQGKIAEALLKVNARVEASLEGQSQQVDPPEGQTRVEKNGSHPLTGLLS